MSMSKKNVWFFILILFLCLSSINVFADGCDKYACATCVYQDNVLTYTLKFVSDENGVLSFNTSGKSITNNAYMANVADFSELKDAHFKKKDTNKIFCPDSLYKEVIPDLATKTKITHKLYSDYTKGLQEIKLSSKENNNLNLSDKSNGRSCTSTCDMLQGTTGTTTKEITITPVGEELSFKLPDGFKINLNHNKYDLTIEDFKDKCPYINCQCGGYGDDNYCWVSKQHLDTFNRDEAQQGYEEQEAGKNTDHNSQVDTNVTLDETIVGEGFCEEDSTRRVLSLVGIILMIAKVLVPLIIILIGSIDLFKAVMSKDEKDLMKSIKSIGLRLLVGVFIFFVPTIVDVVIDLVRDGHNENQCVECVLNPLNCR